MVWVLSSDNCLSRCQIAAWKGGHKTSCRGQGGTQRQLSLAEIRKRVLAAHASEDYAEALRWDSRVEELLVGQNNATTMRLLAAFTSAYHGADQLDKASSMLGRQTEAFEVAGLFDSQVQAMHMAAQSFSFAGHYTACLLWLERARDISTQHGFKLVECNICADIGKMLNAAGRPTEGEEQLRRAAAGVKRLLKDASQSQLRKLSITGIHDPRFLKTVIRRDLVESMASVGRFDEAESLALRLREEGREKADCLLYNHVLRGALHGYRGNFTAAAEAYQAAVEFAGKHPEVLQDAYYQAALDRSKDSLRQVSPTGDAPPLWEICRMVQDAGRAEDHAGVLRWESYLEDMLSMKVATRPFLPCSSMQGVFCGFEERSWTGACRDCSVWSGRVAALPCHVLCRAVVLPLLEPALQGTGPL